MNINAMTNYELIQQKELKDLKSEGYLLRHKKSGARVLLMENDDENKVFTIGFRTPPEDSTGLPHILEHSVLCGSKNFPVKDPFVELVKGSLNTFLNAMTYPDKTVYPVASCNEKDFQNLMHVYMDAVFYPNIYEHDEIFRQEGWSYNLESKEDALTYNGVVYNEMKGAFSSPEGVLDRVILNSLFPDTSYANESGGDPEVIPKLTYEQFLEFHSRYYHPSNSYIYLYGDMDMEEKLEWLDREYLSKFDTLQIDSAIREQAPFDAVKEIEMEYSIASDESEEDNTYLSYNKVIGTSLDRELYLAFQVLDYALLSAPGAPLKKALVDAGIGKDIMGSYDNGIYQPIFSIIAKNANLEQKEEFLSIVERTLSEIVKKGMDTKALEAGINYHEFRYREADFGNYPKGLMYGLQIFDSWLYDDEKPFIHVEAIETFEFLKENIENGYFEKLIQKYLLDNTHGAIVVVKPEKGRTARMDRELEEKLQETIGRQVTAMRDAVLEQNLELNESLAEGNITLDEIDSDIRNGLTGNDIGTSFYHADYEEGSEIEAYASLAKDIRQRIESFRKEKETLSQEQGALTVMKKNFDLFIACLKELPEQNAAGMPLKVNGLDVQGSLFRDVDGEPVDGAVASLKRGRLKITPERIAEAPDLLHFEKGIYCAFMKKGTVKGDIVLYETNFGVTLPTCGNQRTLTSFLGFKKCSLDGLVTLVDAPYRVYDNTVQYRRYLRSKAKREQAV